MSSWYGWGGARKPEDMGPARRPSAPPTSPSCELLGRRLAWSTVPRMLSPHPGLGLPDVGPDLGDQPRVLHMFVGHTRHHPAEVACAQRRPVSLFPRGLHSGSRELNSSHWRPPLIHMETPRGYRLGNIGLREARAPGRRGQELLFLLLSFAPGGARPLQAQPSHPTRNRVRQGLGRGNGEAWGRGRRRPSPAPSLQLLRAAPARG